MSTFELRAPFLPPGSRAVAFLGREAISTPFAFDVYVNAPNGELYDTEDWLQSKATLDLLPPSRGRSPAAAPHVYHGVISYVELVRSVSGSSVFLLRLVPQLQLLSLGTHSRVFTNATIQEILGSVLTEYGLEEGTDFEFAVAGGPPEAHVCQYKETDLDFVHRWLEREGWAYFFDHRGGTDKLVITDAKSWPSLRTEAVRYRPQAREESYAAEAFAHFSGTRRARPAGVVLRDYDYLKPSQPLEGKANVGDRGGRVVAYGQRAFTSGEIDRLAAARAELFKSEAKRFTSRGAATHVQTGFTFELSEHPLPDWNTEYLILEARHFGQESVQVGIPELELGHRDTYRVEVVSSRADVPFRPPLRTPWPTVDGYQNAIVDGAGSSPYALIDDDGRYAVKFVFDEGRGKDGKASTWVRMAQPHGGGVEGHHFPLRKGTEVLCAFLGGDPDRPVIVGAVPNAEKPSLVKAANASQNIIQTGSESYLTIEDQAGSEFINLFSPKEQSGLYLGVGRGAGGRSLTSNAAPDVPPEGPGGQSLGPFSFDLRTDKGHGQLHSGGDFNLKVDASMQRIAKGHTNITNEQSLDYDVIASVDEDYHATLTYGVEGNTTIRLKHEYDFLVHLSATDFYRNEIDVTVKGHTKEVYEATVDCTVSGAMRKSRHLKGFNQVVDGDATDTITGGETVTIEGTDYLEVRGNFTETINGPYNHTVDGHRKVRQFKTQFLTYNDLKNYQWETGGTSVFQSTKIDFTFPLHVEIWNGTHDETVHGVNLAVSGAQVELALMKVFLGQSIDLGFDGLAAKNAFLDFKKTAVSVHVLASQLKTGAARLANHLFRIFV
ncbi:MAG: type VI secretion system tip protein VgrG [Myxococcales bacterium]|nr:type VI secretion system tip protein VgrG [Myxococcales bacterium]